MDLVSWTFANEPSDIDRPVSIGKVSRLVEKAP
jgi:hypothetical protein